MKIKPITILGYAVRMIIAWMVLLLLFVLRGENLFSAAETAFIPALIGCLVGELVVWFWSRVREPAAVSEEGLSSSDTG